ncbi:MAG: DUF1648 domain-containing protein [Bacteroidetes bacterium]|nr:DUF1648 domain-containing protein [Bacteroidota bacterium]
MDKSRPVIQLKVSRLDRLLELLAAGLLLFTWLYCLYRYSSLPQVIPIHFDLEGKPDNYGSKLSLFLFPGIITLVYVLLTVLNRHPHVYNYMQRITAENAAEYYTSATRLIRVIKFVITFFTMLLAIYITGSASKGHSYLPWWLMPAFVLAMILPVIFHVIRRSK